MCIKGFGKSRIDQSFNICRSHGAHLPLPKNPEENEDLKAAVDLIVQWPPNNVPIEHTDIPIDFSDVHEEGVWLDSLWQTKEYTNWDIHSADLNGDYDYAFVDKSTGKWKKSKATTQFAVYCIRSVSQG